MKLQVKNTIPVYDICALADSRHMHEEIIAERFADYLKRHPDLSFPHRHSFYHLVYFTKGGGSHSVDFERFKVSAGQIYFMAPGQIHTWEFAGAVDGYIINFSEALLHSFLKEGQYLDQFRFFSGVVHDCVIQLKAARATVEALFAQIIDETAGDSQYRNEMIRISLLSLFIHVSRDSNPAKTKQIAGPNHLMLRNFRKLVEQHYNQMRLPKEYASMLYITPNHLNALCNDIAGKPAGELIRDRVLLEAKRMLAGTGVGIAEIAWHLNFKDNSYFTKFFKKYTGITPEQFRGTKDSKY